MEEITTINIECYIQEKYTSRMNTKKKKNVFEKQEPSVFYWQTCMKRTIKLSTSSQRKTVLDENRKIAGEMKSDWKSVNRYVNKYA